jgi:hypothetical protein
MDDSHFNYITNFIIKKTLESDLVFELGLDALEFEKM